MAVFREVEGATPAKIFRVNLSVRVFGPLVAALDTLAFVATSGLAEHTYAGGGVMSGTAIASGLIAALVFVLVAKLRRLYAYEALVRADRLLGSLVFATLFGVLATIGIFFLQHDSMEYSRGVSILFAICATIAIVSLRLAFSAFIEFAINRDWVSGRRVILIGEMDELERLTRQDILRFGVREVMRFGLARGASHEPLTPEDRRKVKWAIAAARSHRAVEFAVMISWSREAAVVELSDMLRLSPLTARLYPDRSTRRVISKNRNGGIEHYFSVELQRPPLDAFERSYKRLLDLTVASVVLALLAPLLLFVAVLIKLDSPGPVIFRQRRRGFDNREFRILKFRTMSVLEDGAHIVQAFKGDNRITAVGRVLRRTSIDELPQLINVLRGEMSIVGPRPHAIAHDEEYGSLISEYAYRHHVKPGLTGAAQTAGLRGETRTLAEMEARVKADLWYINNWSYSLDIKILFKTFAALLAHEAY